jgi:ATP-binding cassette subfamily B multidrug efflux pump
VWWFGDGPDADERRRVFTNRQLLARLAPLFRQEVPALLLGSGLLVGVTITMLGGPLLLRELIDSAIPSKDHAAVLFLGGAFALLLIGSHVLAYFQTIVTSRMGLRMLRVLKTRLFRHVLHMPVPFFSDYTPGKLLARVESDTETLRQLVSFAALQLIQSLLMVLGTFGILLALDLKVALVLLIGVPPMAIVLGLFLRFIRKYFKAIRESVARLSGHVTEYVQGVETLRHYGYQSRAKAKLHELNERKRRIDTFTMFLEYPFWGAFQTTRLIAIGAILVVGVPALFDAHDPMTLGTLIAFVEYIRRIFWPLLQLSEFLNFMQRSLVSVERIFEILSFEPEIEDGDGDEPPTLESEIRFENVTFEYEEGHPVLHDVSFALKRGERVALVGASGGGKTTIVNLLLRFHEPKSGRITIDGRNAAGFSRAAWRQLLGLVLQDVYLFPGTVRENLDLGESHDVPEQLEAALRTVHADGLLRRLGEGLDSVLAERGANLSQGERQLLSFARALAANRPVLVLDEATSSVDPYTERLIQDGLEKLLTGRTSLIVAHRLSTVVHADRILVVHKGRLVEEGSHAELYERDGLYRKLFDLQFRRERGTA